MAEKFKKILKEGDDVEKVKALFNSGLITANTEIGKDDGTPLLLAAQKGRLGVVRYLLEVQEIHVEQTNKHGSTALMLASGAGHADVVEHLLANKAEVDRVNTYGNTALILASGYDEGHEDVVELLLSAGADFTVVAQNNKTARSWAKNDNVRSILNSEQRVRRRIEKKKEEFEKTLSEEKEAFEKNLALCMDERDKMTKKREELNEKMKIQEREFECRIEESNIKNEELKEKIKKLEEELKGMASEHNKTYEDHEREDAVADKAKMTKFQERLEEETLQFRTYVERQTREKVEMESRSSESLFTRLVLDDLKKFYSLKDNEFANNSEMKLSHMQASEQVLKEKQYLIMEYEKEIKEGRMTVDAKKREITLIEKKCQEKKEMIAKEIEDIHEIKMSIEQDKIKLEFNEIERREILTIINKLISNKSEEIIKTHALLKKQINH